MLAAEWKVVEDELTLTIAVPANTSAEVIIPTASVAAVREGTRPPCPSTA